MDSVFSGSQSYQAGRVNGEATSKEHGEQEQ